MANIGAKLNREWNVNAAHALYRRVGDWYHTLKAFPGALFDANGYILFETREDYEQCPRLTVRYKSRTTHVSAPGISAIPGYVQKG